MKRIGAFILFFLSFTTAVLSQEDSKVREIISKNGEAKILVKVKNNESLNLLSLFTSIDKKIKDEYLVYVNEQEFNRFLSLNLDYKVYEEAKNEKVLRIAKTIDEMREWNSYPSYQTYVDLMQSFAQNYPNICELDTIGYSVENRLILGLKIHSGDNQNCPKFFYSSTMHGDEFLGTVILMRLADSLIRNYQTDLSISNLLSNIYLYICPIANPDGVYAGGNNNIHNSTRYNANYVDLNRNYPNPALNEHPDGNEHQVETLAFMQYALQEDFDLSINLHGGAEVCNYPWDAWYSYQRVHADKAWFKNICQGFVSTVRNAAGNSYFTDVCSSGIIVGADWYKIYGSRQDWQNWYTKARELTLEISSVKTPSSNLLPNYWNYLKDGLMVFIEKSIVGVNGLVKDISNNQVINSAIIEILNLDDNNSITYSNENGYYFRPLLAGNYDIKIHAEGYNDTIVNVTIENDSTILKDIYLSPSVTSNTNIETYEEELMLYPNPCEDNLCIKSKTLSTYNIYDIHSQFYLSGKLNKGINIINTSHLKSGIYLLKIQNETKIFIKK